MKLAETFDLAGNIEGAPYNGSPIDDVSIDAITPIRIAPAIEGIGVEMSPPQPVLPPTIETAAPISTTAEVAGSTSSESTPTPILAPPALSPEALQTLTKTAERTAANTPITDKATSWLQTDNNMWLAIGGVLLLALGAWFVLKK